MIWLPEPTEPYEYSVSSSWSPGEEREITKQIANHSVRFLIKGTGRTPKLYIPPYGSEWYDGRMFWTAIHWARDYGIPGVKKERFQFLEHKYRLGGLYCYGPFELTERETNYNKYGERPYIETNG